MERNKVVNFAITVTVLAVVFVIASLKLDWSRNGLLMFTFLDVGQGDAILVEVPTGERVLIDGGPDDSVLSELALVSGFINPGIDYVFITHSDADHLAGVFYLAEKYQNIEYKLNLTEANKNSLEKDWGFGGVAFVEGDSLALGEVRFDALWPPEEALGGIADTNDRSIVLKITYGQFCAILTGDVSSVVEEELVDEYGEVLDCQLLKVSHHGSSTASSQEFLDEVSPMVAVVSVGEKNKYGHPNEEVLERLKRVRAVIFRTDKDGRVRIWTNGAAVYW